VRLLMWGVGVGCIVALAMTSALHAKVGFLRMPSIEAVVGPAAMLAIVAVVAGFVPVRASGKVDVAQTLRADS